MKCSPAWDAPESGGRSNTRASSRTLSPARRESLATMDLLEDGMMENARKMGEYIFAHTADWTNKFKIVGDVRGKGLMVGIEIVRDQRTKERAGDLRHAIVDSAFHKGLLVLGP